MYTAYMAARVGSGTFPSIGVYLLIRTFGEQEEVGASRLLVGEYGFQCPFVNHLFNYVKYSGVCVCAHTFAAY